MNKTEINKYGYIELLRAIAIIAVVFNHTGESGFFLFASQEMYSLSSYIYCFLSIFCKFAIYVFFMISGALLLGKQESISTILKKRVSKYIIIFVVWSFLNYLLGVIRGDFAFDLVYFFKTIYSYDLGFNLSYWFLLAYICFLLTLPVLRIIASRMDKELFCYIVILKVALDVVFFAGRTRLFPGITPNIDFKWLDTSFVFYPLVGYYLHNNDLELKKYIVPLWALNIALIVLCSYFAMRNMILIENFAECNDTQIFHTSFVFVNALCVFITAKEFCLKTGKWIEFLGSTSFGVYLMHYPVLQLSVYWLIYKLFAETMHLGYMAGCLLTCLCMVAILSVVTWVLRKIPFVNRIV